MEAGRFGGWRMEEKHMQMQRLPLVGQKLERWHDQKVKIVPWRQKFEGRWRLPLVGGDLFR